MSSFLLTITPLDGGGPVVTAIAHTLPAAPGGGGPVDPGYSPPWARPPVDPGYSPPWAQVRPPVDPGYSPPWAQVPPGGGGGGGGGGGPVDPGYSPPWAQVRPPVDPGYSPPWAQVPQPPEKPDNDCPEGYDLKMVMLPGTGWVYACIPNPAAVAPVA